MPHYTCRMSSNTLSHLHTVLNYCLQQLQFVSAGELMYQCHVLFLSQDTVAVLLWFWQRDVLYLGEDKYKEQSNHFVTTECRSWSQICTHRKLALAFGLFDCRFHINVRYFFRFFFSLSFHPFIHMLCKYLFFWSRQTFEHIFAISP